MFTQSSLPAAALVLAASFLAYYNSLSDGFVFDDHRAILTNDDLDAGKTSLRGLFANDFWGGHMSRTESHKSYRPLTVLTYRYFNFWLAGLEPLGYHLVNVLLHCTASVLFLFLCQRLLGERRKWPAAYAAVLFSVHSIHTEAVSCTSHPLYFTTCIKYLCCVQHLLYGHKRCFTSLHFTSLRLQVLWVGQKCWRVYSSSCLYCAT